jgi:putative ABC transport system permease protein
VDRLRQDLRHAWRGLTRDKGFTAAAVLTLAVGMAATTIMFALIHGVLLRPLPVHDQNRLLVAWKMLPATGFAHFPFERREIDIIARESRTFERVAGVGYGGAGRSVLADNGEASHVRDALVTGEFFEVLRVRPMLGRALNPLDDVDGAENVLVITHALWQRRYGGAHDGLGRRVTVDERPFTIVGVMPPDLDYPRGVEAWRATASLQPGMPFYEAATRDFDLVGRLREDATKAHAESELQALIRRLEAEAPPAEPRGLQPVVRLYADVVVGDVRPALLVLFGAVGFVLLVASANVANLLLVRGAARAAEFAVRAALGADRGRLAGQLLAESALLAVASSAVAVAAAWWILPLVIAFVPGGLPRTDAIRIDAGVAAFTALVAFVTAALAGLAPAWWSTRVSVVSHLRGAGRGGNEPAHRFRRRTLIVVQAALAVTVVSGAGLLTRSLLALQSVEMGLEADRLVFVELAMPPSRSADRERHIPFLDAVLKRLEAAPAIEAATPINVPAFSGGWDVPQFAAEGQTAEQAATNPALSLESIYPNYFQTLGIPIVRGRAFTDADRSGSIEVAIVTDDVAERTWPGEDPIGKRIKMGGLDSSDNWRTIVGVVKPARYRDLTQARATLYLPAKQFLATAQILLVRTVASMELVTSLAREQVAAVDPAVPVVRVVAFATLLETPLAQPRFNAWLIGVFGLTALLLAAVGIYGVTAADARQRQGEMGVRIALGATPGHVWRLVLWGGLRLSVLGAVVGVALAAASTALLRGLLYGVQPLDPATFLAATGLLVAVSAFAAYLPARRAASVDPITLLRAE